MNWTISIGGVVMPRLTSIGLTEEEESIGGYVARRMQSGRLVTQEHWSRKRYTIAAEAIVPDGLAGLDFGAQLTLMATGARSMRASNATTAFTLPAGRRSDAPFQPRAWYWAGALRIRNTFASVVGDVYTVDTVAGAEHYEVEYWPQLTVKVVERPRRQLANAEHRYRWSFVAEEV